jgi:hypothetical protein
LGHIKKSLKLQSFSVVHHPSYCVDNSSNRKNKLIQYIFNTNPGHTREITYQFLPKTKLLFQSFILTELLFTLSVHSFKEIFPFIFKEVNKCNVAVSVSQRTSENKTK